MEGGLVLEGLMALENGRRISLRIRLEILQLKTGLVLIASRTAMSQSLHLDCGG